MRLTLKNGLPLAAAGLFVALSSPLVAQQKSDQTSPEHAKMTSKAVSDTHFAQEAAMGGKMEVELGKLATQKAANDKVKQFGQRMADDHGKAGDQLKSIAAKENISLPDKLDAKEQATVDKLSSLSGAAFDRAYMREMVKDHQHDVADFQKEADHGTNTNLKTWASTTLPTLQEHLRLAQETENAVSTTH
jgi:putative membrane protein